MGVVVGTCGLEETNRFLGLERQDGLGGRMIPGPHFSAGRAMLAPVHYDDQVPSPPSLLKVRRQSVRLSDQPALFWSDWGKSSARKIGRIFERFLHFLGQAHRTGNPLGRLASEVLGLSNARVIAALRQQLPGDSSHQTCRSQNCEVGLLAKRPLAFVEVSEVGRATDGNPSGLDEGPAKPFVAMW